MFAVWPSLEEYWCCYGESAVMKRDRNLCIRAAEERLIVLCINCCGFLNHRVPGNPLIHPASITAGAPPDFSTPRSLARPPSMNSSRHEQSALQSAFVPFASSSTMSRIFKRAASSAAAEAAATSTPSTLRPASAASALAKARFATQPHAIRDRQSTYLAGTDKVTSDNGVPSLTPSQEIRFQTLRAEGKLAGDEALARLEFIRNHDAWRSRVRGHRQVQNLPARDAAKEDTTDVPGTLSSPARVHAFTDANTVPGVEFLAAQRIYLPNIQIRLMRNHTLPGEPYDTSIATFRIPPSMTKNDLRSYLYAVYGLPVTFIRTDNYIAPQARVGTTNSLQRIKGSEKTYKRAVVGLLEPFHYPDDVAELDAIIDSPATDAEAELRRSRAVEGKKKREEWMNAQFMSDLQVSQRKRSMMKLAKGWRWRGQTHDNSVSGRAMACRGEFPHSVVTGQHRSGDHEEAPGTGERRGRGCQGIAHQCVVCPRRLRNRPRQWRVVQVSKTVDGHRFDRIHTQFGWQMHL